MGWGGAKRSSRCARSWRSRSGRGSRSPRIGSRSATKPSPYLDDARLGGRDDVTLRPRRPPRRGERTMADPTPGRRPPPRARKVRAARLPRALVRCGSPLAPRGSVAETSLFHRNSCSAHPADTLRERPDAAAVGCRRPSLPAFLAPVARRSSPERRSCPRFVTVFPAFAPPRIPGWGRRRSGRNSSASNGLSSTPKASPSRRR